MSVRDAACSQITSVDLVKKYCSYGSNDMLSELHKNEFTKS